MPDVLSQVVASHTEHEVVAGSLDHLDQHLQKLIVFLVKSVIKPSGMLKIYAILTKTRM